MTKANPYPTPVALFFALLVSEEPLLAEVEKVLEQEFAPIMLRSPLVPFDFTPYYEREMGTGILRRWVACDRTIDPSDLASIKLRTNQLEDRWVIERDGLRCRRVNIDPGYLTLAKVVLASCKERDHRIYLRDGVFAEVTLSYRRAAKRFERHPWTYPDHLCEVAQTFFLDLRSWLAQRTSNTPTVADF